MRYVQFQVAPHLSDLLSARAEQEDVVLGQVVIDAVRKFDALSDAAKSPISYEQDPFTGDFHPANADPAWLELAAARGGCAIG